MANRLSRRIRRGTLGDLLVHAAERAWQAAKEYERWAAERGLDCYSLASLALEERCKAFVWDRRWREHIASAH